VTTLAQPGSDGLTVLTRKRDSFDVSVTTNDYPSGFDSKIVIAAGSQFQADTHNRTPLSAEQFDLVRKDTAWIHFYKVITYDVGGGSGETRFCAAHVFDLGIPLGGPSNYRRLPGEGRKPSNLLAEHE
jgi:hypothetical protein